jgi:hypothetical protein
VPGRGPLTHKKKQRELQQKEKQAEKLARRLERKLRPPAPEEETLDTPLADVPQTHDDGT